MRTFVKRPEQLLCSASKVSHQESRVVVVVSLFNNVNLCYNAHEFREGGGGGAAFPSHHHDARSSVTKYASHVAREDLHLRGQRQ